jgi:ABC-type transport system involved in cytochrome c biogenesis permease component
MKEYVIRYCFGEKIIKKQFEISFYSQEDYKALLWFEMLVTPVFVISITEKHLKLN